MAVATPCTHQFLNFSAIAAPSSRNAAFNIVVGALVGSGYILVVVVAVKLWAMFAALVWAAF
ncbi:hypothetical protein [Photobacterium sanguinicancri]|uniref:hypothetical protein n=1 Tax=Photobacterium sanguinicancri TaxID=875932 RepID=UPI003D0D2195